MQQTRRILRLTGLIAILLFTSFAGLTAQERTLDELFDEAFQAYDDRNYELSVQLYTEYISRNTSSANVYNNRGLGHYQLGNYAAALADYNTALDLRANSEDRESLANTYNNRGDAHYVLGDYQAALDDHRRAVTLDPENRSARFNIAYTYFALGNYEAALDAYNYLIEQNPAYVSAINNRAVIYETLGDNFSALVDYNRVVQLDPDYELGHRNRAGVLRELERYDEAFAAIETAINLDSTAPRAYIERAHLHYLMGDYDAAVEDYTIAAQRDEQTGEYNYPEAFLGRGLTHLKRNPANPIEIDLSLWRGALDADDILEDTLPMASPVTFEIETGDVLKFELDPRPDTLLDVTVSTADEAFLSPVIVLRDNLGTYHIAYDDRNNGTTTLGNIEMFADRTYELYVLLTIPGDDMGSVEVTMNATPIETDDGADSDDSGA